MGGDSATRDDVKDAVRLAAAVEQYSEHPLGRAVMAAAGRTTIPPVADFRAVPGSGVQGTVDGSRVQVLGPVTEPAARSAVENIQRARGTAAVLVADDVPVAVLVLHDELHPDAGEAVDALRRRHTTLLLTGDNPVTVRDDLNAVAAAVELAGRARPVVVANPAIAAGVIVALVVWDLVGHLPLPLGVAGHEGSTILVALNGMRLLGARIWRGGRSGISTSTAAPINDRIGMVMRDDYGASCG